MRNEEWWSGASDKEAPRSMKWAMPALGVPVTVLSHQSPVTSHQSLVTLINRNVRHPAGVFACIFISNLWGDYGILMANMIFSD